MDPYAIGEALRAVPRRIGQTAALLLAAGLLLNGGWATSLVTAVVAQRADATARYVQDSLLEQPAAPRKG
jgi:hypothetical protein